MKDLHETVQELLNVVPQEKKQLALEEFLAVYNSYPSYRSLVGTKQYQDKMHEKLNHAYQVAIDATKN